MPEYLTPGVYVEDISSGLQPIAAVPTATVAFVGATPHGPLNEPVVVKSHADYREIFDPAPTSSPVSLAAHLFFVNGGRKAVVVRVTSADRRGKSRANSKNVIGDADARTGIHALRDGEPLGLLLTPDAAEMSGSEVKAIAKGVVKFCEEHRVFYILDLPRQARSKRGRIRAVADWAKQSGTLRHPNAAVYFPRISISDPSGKPGSVLVSPSGAIAGVYARTDAERGVWKAPAGLEARLHGVEETEMELTDEEMNLLQQTSINPLRRFQERRIVPWGARTFEPTESNSEWRYIPVRRLALFIEESLYQGLAWAVFEPNGDPLWAQIRLAASSFMNQLFRAGAFQGASLREAYFVKCSRETMTESDIQAGRLVMIVGFAPLKPAEFVILRIQMKVTQ